MCDVVEISDDEEEQPQFPLEQCRNKRVSTASSESSEEDEVTSSIDYIIYASSHQYSQDSVSCADRRKVLSDTCSLVVYYDS